MMFYSCICVWARSLSICALLQRSAMCQIAFVAKQLQFLVPSKKYETFFGQLRKPMCIWQSVHMRITSDSLFTCASHLIDVFCWLSGFYPNAQGTLGVRKGGKWDWRTENKKASGRAWPLQMIQTSCCIFNSCFLNWTTFFMTKF